MPPAIGGRVDSVAGCTNPSRMTHRGKKGCMAGLCRVLVAAALGGHLTVGCCWHHAHGHEGGFFPVRSGAAHDGQGCENECDHSHHGPNNCQGPRCSFVSSGRAVDALLVQPLEGAFAALLEDRPSPAGCLGDPLALASGRLLLPVRLHLANQVLLI